MADDITIPKSEYDDLCKSKRESDLNRKVQEMHDMASELGYTGVGRAQHLASDLASLGAISKKTCSTIKKGTKARNDAIHEGKNVEDAQISSFSDAAENVKDTIAQGFETEF